MTEPLYKSLLDPADYKNNAVAEFVYSLVSPEIESLSESELESTIGQVAPADDAMAFFDECLAECEEKIKQHCHFKPFFIAIGPDNKRTRLSSPVPISETQINDLLLAGKCLAFITRAQAVLFATEVFHDGNQPIWGEKPDSNAQWGIFIIGSTVRGHTIQQLTAIAQVDNTIGFKEISKTMNRDSSLASKIGRFFYIQDHQELCEIVTRIPKIQALIPSTAVRSAPLNFMTSLKILQTLGYEK